MAVNKPQPIAVEVPTENEDSYEQQHVHQVYEEIASHFSETRYKACESASVMLSASVNRVFVRFSRGPL